MTVKVRPYRKGGWEVDITIRLPDGTPYRERVKSPTLDEEKSRVWGYKREAYLLAHGPQPKKPQGAEAPRKKKEVPTLAEFAPRYIEGYHVANGHKPSTQGAALDRLRAHLIPALGHKRLDAITQEDVQKLKAKLRKQHDHDPRTINAILSTLSTLLKSALDWEVIEQVPVKLTRLRTSKKTKSIWESDEYEHLLGVAKSMDPIIHAFILLCGDAGLRNSEARALHWTSVNLNVGMLTVERSEWRGHITTTKGHKIRHVPITQRLREALQALSRDGDPFVLGTEGRYLRHGTSLNRLRAVEEEAKLQRYDAHTLRHTFCSHLAMRAMPAPMIQSLAGHSDLATTEEYIHITREAMESARKFMEAPNTAHFAVSGDTLETPPGSS